MAETAKEIISREIHEQLLKAQFEEERLRIAYEAAVEARKFCERAQQCDFDNEHSFYDDTNGVAGWHRERCKFCGWVHYT